MTYEEELVEYAALKFSLETRVKSVMALCMDYPELYYNIDRYVCDTSSSISWEYEEGDENLVLLCESVDEYDELLDLSDVYAIPVEWLDMSSHEIVECLEAKDALREVREVRKEISTLEAEAERLGYKIVPKEEN